ncbi:SDR family NAD(P)-dependent oxidoreductase [Shinella sp.]|uniref:SDR family NAD(P)-dependent oxidoreductase n=1 Tax=Shinella sp. TaxID=1870904 RepID=UPI003F6FF626
MQKVALIVGASRGLGLGLAEAFLARGWEVIATVRNERGRAALEALAGKGTLSIVTMDITVAKDIDHVQKTLSGRRLDVLFVNAGIANDPAAPIKSVPERDFLDVMATNALAPLRVIGALYGLMAPDGVVAAMSSNMGSVSGNAGGGWDVYRASKAALNQLMKSFAARHADGKTYLAVSPGWVRTDMGGDGAPLDVETSAAGIVATLIARAGSGGVQFVDFRNETIAW